MTASETIQMNRNIILACSLLGVNSALIADGDQPQPMHMGDGTVRGERLEPYEDIWIQCALQDGSWTDGGQLTETLLTIGDVLRHSQRVERPNGPVSVSTTYFDRASIAPLRMEQRVTSAEGELLRAVTRTLTEDGYEGKAEQGGQKKEIAGKISSRMWHGGALGLPLVTVDPTRFPVEFTSSMVAFDGTYRTIATLAGHEKLEHRGQTVDAMLVDVEWHHNESGDVYPPGPDGSGGRFWLLPEPPDGLPYVLQYQTDSYLVSTLMDACPGN